MKILPLLLSLLFAFSAKAQNMVPNESFEDVTNPTTRWSGTHSAFHRNINGWTSPTQGSPDVLFIEYRDRMYPRRPRVNLLPYTPRTGNYMMGIKTFGCAVNTLHCKEYLQIRLKRPVRAGKEYYFEYWVCPIASSVKVNGFGVALLPAHMQDIGQLGLINVSPACVDETLIDRDTAWQKVSGTFLAEADFAYLILGNFMEDKAIPAIHEAAGIDYGYYLIDDVLLKPLFDEPASDFRPDEIIVLEDILFDFDKAVLKEGAFTQLEALAAYLKEHSEFHLEIRGHTDSEGSDAYNVALSLKRASAVKQYLVHNGIASDRLQAKGFGKEYPVSKSADEESHKLNRRVEVRIYFP
ncbi:MAG: OmpA family protein [Bacteroidetes bacterium]|nr:OmpA family protein [Bacteroidota bacterium]